MWLDYLDYDPNNTSRQARKWPMVSALLGESSYVLIIMFEVDHSVEIPWWSQRGLVDQSNSQRGKINNTDPTQVLLTPQSSLKLIPCAPKSRVKCLHANSAQIFT